MSDAAAEPASHPTSAASRPPLSSRSSAATSAASPRRSAIPIPSTSTRRPRAPRGHPRIPAPPTFAIALRANDPRGGIELDWRKLLHGEQELVFARPLYAGDRLTIVGRIATAAVKQAKSGVLGRDGARDRRHRRRRRPRVYGALDHPGAPMKSASAMRCRSSKSRRSRPRSSCSTPAPRATSIASTMTSRSRATAAFRR